LLEFVMSGAHPTPHDEGAGPHGTRMESFDEVMRELGGRAKRTPTLKEEEQLPDTQPFRPTRRPPLALLCALDDGRDDGEWFRLRRPRFVIGRTEGDLVIAHDDMMSGRHAELTRELDKGRPRWYLTDLRSTNGTYVRTSHTLLRNGQDFLIGSRRFRFEAAPADVLPAEGAGEPIGPGTRGWQGPPPGQLVPSIVEVTLHGPGPRTPLKRAEHWLGRDATRCDIVLADDPLVSPRHARLFLDPKGRWRLENAQSLNGTWVRIERMPLDGAGQFQLGEQRFLVRPLS
jgi:pSer/pThr/pTyr-binding forkhead associated (FHA) protein